MEVQIFSRFLRGRGQRLTKVRADILRKAFSYHGHFGPESLYLMIKESGLKASRASVYRTLGLLCECGLIEKVKTTKGGTTYEHTFGHKHHDHIFCILCEKVIEFYSRDLERIQEELCKKYGFKGVSHTLEIRGYCKECQKKGI